MSPTSRFRTRWLPAAAVAAALVAAAAVATPAHALDTGRSGPSVEQYLDLSSSGLNRLQRRGEELIAACMKREGFEYTPDAQDIPKDAVESLVGNRKAFVQKYGYGISTFVEPPRAGAVDPNAAYLAKLSAADRRAYRVALIGVDSDDPGAAAPSGVANTKSCVGQAQRALYGDMARYAALISKFDELDRRLQADPKVVKAVREWSACMKASGYRYAKEDDVTADLNRRLESIAGASAGGGTPGAAPARIDVPGLRRLQKDELAIAKVDWDCSVKHLGPRDEAAKVLNRDFIAQNRAALDGLRKALGS